jgi:regulator of cell morphogenesis and NO signaling
MKALIDKNVGEIVAENYRTAAVFQNYEIDFCCNGNRKLGTVCNEKGLATKEVERQLQEAMRASETRGLDFRSWSPGHLADYIEEHHHTYVEQQLPRLKQLLAKIAQVHGAKHPELNELVTVFNESAADLAKHMKKEELILFPYIQKMEAARKEGKVLENVPFRTVKNPLEVMMGEHDTEGKRFRAMRNITNNYTLPDDACLSWTTAYRLLQEFEADLHMHIHLENNILFPAALKWEMELRA